MQGEAAKTLSHRRAYQPRLFLKDKEIEQNHLCLSFPGVSALSARTALQ
ncbi:MAG: hypothetical protein ACLR4Z_12045 [Butyricicoccaceae bacterium]